MQGMDNPAIPAATVVVMRACVDGAPELLMVERAKAMAFAGGALVFPGGRVDPGDHALAALLVPDAVEETAHRIAAVREAVEEAGVAPGVVPAPDGAGMAAMRDALDGGGTIAEALHAIDAHLDLTMLEPFARWMPEGVKHRVFDTRFYLAELPAGAPEPRVDATENSRLSWMRASDVLAQADAGRVTIIFPTRRNLERLARFASFADAVADARAHEVRTITPWVEERADGAHLCIPADLGYPVTSQPLADAIRA